MMVNIVQGFFLLVILLVIASTIINGVLTFLVVKLYTELIKMYNMQKPPAPPYYAEGYQRKPPKMETGIHKP